MKKLTLVVMLGLFAVGITGCKTTGACAKKSACCGCGKATMSKPACDKGAGSCNKAAKCAKCGMAKAKCQCTK